MNLQIVYWNHPALSAVCSPVEISEFGPELFYLGKEMLSLMKEKRGIGLAASQVNLLKNLFVMERKNGETIIVVNPKIVVSPDAKIVNHEEGCLSIPTVYNFVSRPNIIEMTYQDPLDGHECTVVLDDYDAYCAQHEMDHSQGIMFFDRRRVSRQINRAVEREWKNKKGE